MSKTGSFFLGMFCGVIAFILCIAIAGYCVLAFVTPNNINNQSGNYIGTLADKSLLEIIKEFQTLYTEANIVNPDAEGNYFTIADFEQRYQVNLSQSLGINLTDEIKKMPVLSLFTPDGINKVLGQTSISAVSDIVGIFTGSGLFDQSVSQQLSQFSVTEMFSQPLTVLKSLKFGDVIKLKQTRGLSDSMMEAFAECNIGETLEVLFNGGNFLLAVKNGPLSPIGQLHFYEITGGTADNSLFGDKTFAEVITDDGNLDPSLMVQGQFLGQLLGNSRKQLDTATIEQDYPNLVGKFNKNSTTTFTVRQGDFGYAMTIDEEQWYEAKLDCKDAEHQHTYSCYKFVWYTDNTYAETISPLIAKIADCEFEDLNGSGFSNIINTMTLRDVMGDSAVTNGILKCLADVELQNMSATINTLKMGEVLDYARTEVKDTTAYNKTVLTDGNVIIKSDSSSNYIKSTDGGTTWYVARLACDNTHTHNVRCYQYWIRVEGQQKVSPTGFMASICDLTIQDIQGGDAFNNTINNMTFGEVIGNTDSAMLSALQDTKLSEIGTAIDNLYMGTALGLYRKQISDKTMTQVVGNVYKYQDNGDKYAIKDGDKYYSAELTCTDTHTHTETCYSVIWYTNAQCTTEANSLNKKLANHKLSQLDTTEISKIVVESVTVKEMMDSNVLNFSESAQANLTRMFGTAEAWQSMAIGDFINALTTRL